MKNDIINISSIAEAHRLFGLPKPKHPLISVFRHGDLVIEEDYIDQRFIMDLYLISLKVNQQNVLKYGRNTYDFQEGTIVFMAPNQIFSTSSSDYSACDEEWNIIFHPDFLYKTHLSELIEQLDYFDYESNEALHLSDEEKHSLTDFVIKIEREYNQNIDKHTHELIAINLESILKYCQRYYARQFITRTHAHQDYVVQFERYLKDYFSGSLIDKGLPSVKQCGQALNMSPHYLSDLLKAETGKSAKEHIDLSTVNKAKTLLLQSKQSISEVAYEMGFEYPNHFSKVFKAKTGFSPSDFRKLN